MERIMTVADVSLSMNLRLNKGDSQDYDNLWNYHKANAFNKAVSDWVRRQIRGKNQTQEGDEESTARVDDLQVLLKQDNLTIRDKGVYVESNKLPTDYLYYKRLTPIVSKGKCSSIRITSDLREEANVDRLLPTCSFEFEETFHTLVGNKIRIYHNKEFTIEKADLMYYRKPKVYDFGKINDTVEFKDDVCEILIDEACKILGSDIESFNQKNAAQERAENNN
jgi:hypothetical protein